MQKAESRPTGIVAWAMSVFLAALALLLTAHPAAATIYGDHEGARPWYERAVAQAEQGDVHGRVDHESLELSKRALDISAGKMSG